MKPILSQLLTLNVSIVFCSSKTRAEIEFYRKKMGINDPFIVENGSAIFIPKRYFPLDYSYTRQTARYFVIELGISYSIVRKKLEKVMARTAASIVGFGDMASEEIAKDSGLTLQLAKLARRREYDEPFQIVDGNEEEILCAIKEEGLSYTKGGRYFHMGGNSDKGKAAGILKDLYSQKFGRITTIGVGDSISDLSMLEVVDKPFLVRKTACKNADNKVWREILNIVAKPAQDLRV